MLRKCIFAVAFVLAIMMTTTYARSLPEPQIVSSARARSCTPVDVVETSESRIYRNGDQLKEVEFYERATVRQPIDAVTYFTNNSKSRAMVSIIAGNRNSYPSIDCRLELSSVIIVMCSGQRGATGTFCIYGTDLPVTNLEHSCV